MRRSVRCVEGAVGAEVDADVSKCPSPAPEGEVPCNTHKCDFCERETCSYRGTCSEGACDCGPTRIGLFCDVSRVCGFDQLGTLDGRCCAGTIDAVGMCCPTHLPDAPAVIDGDGNCCYSGKVDACGECDGAARTVDVRGECCPGKLDAGGFCCGCGDNDTAFEVFCQTLEARRDVHVVADRADDRCRRWPHRADDGIAALDANANS